MKTTLTITKLLLALIIGFYFKPAEVQAQTVKSKKQTLTILNIDSQGMNMNPTQLGNLVRIEVDKLDSFEVTDRYDVAYLLDKNKVNASNCYGKICLLETGKAISTDKMLGGSIETYSNTIVVTLKLINVKSESVEKTYIKEFLNLPEEIQSIIRISVREMFNLPNPPELLSQLTKPYNYESIINNPKKEKLNLSGPRMGFIALTGTVSKIFMNPKSEGGYEAAYPAMFQFGYQFEAQYLSEGNFSALFEMVPMISGFDQSMIIPSFTLMNGLRNVANGWEFALGPTFNYIHEASMYSSNGKWFLADDWNLATPNPNQVVTREDSRGNLKIRSQFVVAVGKTFKSGKMNIPVNMYVMPGRDGIRFGVSFGYNAKR